MIHIGATPHSSAPTTGAAFLARLFYPETTAASPRLPWRLTVTPVVKDGH